MHLYRFRQAEAPLNEFFFHLQPMNIIETRNHQQIILLGQQAAVVVEHLRMDGGLKVGEDQIEFS